MFSEIESEGANPVPFLSSGTYESPALRAAIEPLLVTFVPQIVTCPSISGVRPAIPSASARWPFPETPAIPTISPAFTTIDALETWLRALFAVKSRTSSRGAPAGLVARIAERSTSLPTIMRASSSRDVSATAVLPTTFPSRITVTRSEISITSPSLCEIKMTLLPSLASVRTESKRVVTSCGVRTLVGSSSSKICAPR
ncbi:unannotated protein [freshwater metagenome]|uniref:Unannotated protein n=1 Tax=freshwater metagenome TaxID=449393 RepID=A0A6J6VT46_9ZZZZ